MLRKQKGEASSKDVKGVASSEASRKRYYYHLSQMNNICSVLIKVTHVVCVCVCVFPIKIFRYVCAIFLRIFSMLY